MGDLFGVVLGGVGEELEDDVEPEGGGLGGDELGVGVELVGEDEGEGGAPVLEAQVEGEAGRMGLGGVVVVAGGDAVDGDGDAGGEGGGARSLVAEADGVLAGADDDQVVVEAGGLAVDLDADDEPLRGAGTG